MKTFYQMIKELDEKYEPEQRGVVIMKEIHKINKALCLDDMNDFALRNLRDMVVMFYNLKIAEGDIVPTEEMDKMSAITTVIDNKIMCYGI